jgi:hypothetical protein
MRVFVLILFILTSRRDGGARTTLSSSTGCPTPAGAPRK